MKQSKEEEQPESESRLHLCGYHVQSEEKVQLEVSKCESLNLELKLAQQESCDQQLQVRSLAHLPGHILLYNDIWMWLGNCCNGHGTCHIRWILLACKSLGMYDGSEQEVDT